MDADDIATLLTAFFGILILALALWCDRERQRFTDSGHLQGKVTAIRGSNTPAERRPRTQQHHAS